MKHAPHKASPPKAVPLILLCLLPALFTQPSFAASVTLNPGNDLAAAFAQAASGDTIAFGAGTFNLSSPISVPSGVTVSGTGVNTTHVVFTLPGGDSASYAFNIAANASHVTIQGLDVVSNLGLIEMANGSAYSNVVITNNDFAYGTGTLSDGTLVFGIYVTIANTGTKITYNYFHDSPNTARNWNVWFASNANFDHNLFYNITDGGQIDDPGANVSFSYNYGTLLNRMGQECALTSASTFTCNNNVFYNYVSPYYDTEGVSIVGPSGLVNITNNYFDASFAPGSTWGPADGGGTNRFGYAIECTGQPCNVTGNTLIGVWADDVSSDIANANVSNNSVYGYGLWGDFDGEPGPFGQGSVVATKNTIDTNIADAPAPPANTFAGPANFNGGTTNSLGNGSTTQPSTGTSGSGSAGTSGTGSSGTSSSGSGSTASGNGSKGSSGSGTSGSGNSGHKGSTSGSSTGGGQGGLFGSGSSGSGNSGNSDNGGRRNSGDRGNGGFFTPGFQH
jgi:hypothetical protein